jgi:uncharacterized protein with HEPN domain
MNERDIVRLRHMLDETRKAQEFVQTRTRDDLDSDELLAYAVRYALQIVGEAASQVTAETRTQHPKYNGKTSSECASGSCMVMSECKTRLSGTS